MIKFSESLGRSGLEAESRIRVPIRRKVNLVNGSGALLNQSRLIRCPAGVEWNFGEEGKWVQSQVSSSTSDNDSPLCSPALNSPCVAPE
ncbi:hypothetical protein AVEN_128025-1 [Araneus ventricosus]|uniref:Uncharacterized protein n=1 Tax=Araneus ventricosus TaxID=182803 RepID=A0A4Y1ZZB9_ARAVE|nr:hypothetical protein AVEN_128025-1 [Araneus ventricosus]